MTARQRSSVCGGSSLLFRRHVALVGCLLLLVGLGKGCRPNGVSNSGVTKGKSTYVCLVVSSPEWQGGANNYSRLAFTPAVDKFSRLEFKNSYKNATIEGDPLLKEFKTVSFHVESMGVISYQKHYRSTTGEGQVFPVFTVIISVDKGVVQSVIFDEGCVLCDNNARCVSNTYDYSGVQYQGAGSTSDCYLTNGECVTSPSTCQLTLYVVWTGTDKNGNYLTSSSKRFSLFSSYSVNSYFNGLGKRIVATPGNYDGGDA